MDADALKEVHGICGLMSHPKDKTCMAEYLAQGHKCHNRDSNPHSAVQKHQEPESGALNRPATTLPGYHATALLSKSETCLDSGEDKPCTSSASQLNAGGASSYDQYQYPTESADPKRGESALRNTHQMKLSGDHDSPDTDRCNNVAVDIERVRPPAPSTTVRMPVMYPRDSDVLPTAILMTFCCPVCGCMAISQARKARRLREEGKYTSSALASDASSWWAWSAALSGCFIILGMAISAMVFMLLKLVQM